MSAFFDACRSKAVQASIKKAGKPIVLAALAQWAALAALLLPISIGLRLVRICLVLPCTRQMRSFGPTKCLGKGTCR